MKISVALAAYNGEKYIAGQISSILPQLGENDEIIISDDNPCGGTKAAVEAFGDPRIRYIEGPGKGVVKNFENALLSCTGDYIFLCDQDDVWMPDKVEKVLAEFKNGAELVLHDAVITDADLEPIGSLAFAVHGANDSFAKNLIKNTFVGCCMAFTAPLLRETLPFPGNIPMHDWWIALAAMKRGRKVVLLCEPLIKWRRHGENVTGGKTSFGQKLRWRLSLISSLKII